VYQPTKEDFVNKNMGSADRKLRTFVVAPVLVIAGVLAGPATGLAIVLYALAAVMLATSAVGTCPLYLLFGLSTGAPKSTANGSAVHVSAR
jgi:hypothetical protein